MSLAHLGREQAARAAWLGFWRAMQAYHRYEVQGFHHLERKGAALLVGYHGRPLALDQCMLTAAIHDRLGYLPHAVAHGYFLEQPRLRPWAQALSLVAGDGPEVEQALARGEHLLVQPGGTREGCRSVRHRYRVDWGERVGYLRLALRHRLPIIPVAGRGVDDTYLGLNDGAALGKRLGMPGRVPLWLGLGPLGAWPLSPPFPVQITQVIGPPLDVASRGVDPADREALLRLHREVAREVQSLLDRANQPRRRPRRPGARAMLGVVPLTPRLTRAGVRPRPAPSGALAGRVCLVTGGSRGLGLAIARGLAAQGAEVGLVCRDPAQGERARAEVEAVRGGRAWVELADLASVASVQALAGRLQARLERLDVLVNNAGASFGALTRSAEGHELTFATNVLGGFHLTRGLLPLLRASAPARVVEVGSAAQYLVRLRADALRWPGRQYLREQVYAHSKRAQAELAGLWAERLQGSGVRSFLMHPGLVDTPGARGAFPRYHTLMRALLRSPEQGADTAVWLASAPGLPEARGGIWFDRELHPGHRLPWSTCEPAEAERLWELCEALVARASPAPEGLRVLA